MMSRRALAPVLMTKTGASALRLIGKDVGHAWLLTVFKL